MWMALFGFEVRYQLRQPLVYLITFFLSVLLFIAGTGEGPGAAVGALQLNAPAVILEHLVKGIYLILFLMTAYVVSAALRDFDRQTAELFFSKPISRMDYMTARFAGAIVVCALPYLIGATVLAIGTLMPWLEPSRVGAFRIAPYAFGFGVLILPTLLALGATFYALAMWTRNTLATYVGVVAFFAINATAGLAASQLESRWIGQLLDPFGIAALAGTVRYWTVVELNTNTPDIAGILLWNRVLWLSIGLAAFAVTIATFDPSRARQRAGTRRVEAPGAADDETPALGHARATQKTFTGRTVALQFAYRVLREAKSVILSLPFLGIQVLGLLVLLQAAENAGSFQGMPVYPRTPLMLDALRGGYAIVLLLAVILIAGELLWKERTHELHEIHDAMPTPNGVYFGAKLTALLLAIVVYLAIGVLALVGYQLFSGYTNIDLRLYVQGAAMVGVYPALMMVLASFFQVLVRNRLLGYGCVLLFIVSWDLIEEFGFEHHLYRYASLPPTPHSDFSGYGPLLAPFAWYGLYWSLFALVLIGLSTLLWKRGTDDAWRSRWREGRMRFRGLTRSVLGAGTFGVVMVGSWIFYNTNVLNAYTPSQELAAHRAHYEQLYGQYEGIALPRIIAVRTDVDIFPRKRRVVIRGVYRLRNMTTQALRDVHVSMPEHVRLDSLRLPAHDVVLHDDSLGYRIYRLRQPLQSDASVEVHFHATMDHRGFVNHGTNVAVLENGTYFTNRDVLPVFGYDAHRQLADPDERKRLGLEPTPVLAQQDNPKARGRSPRAPDADRIQFEATLSTSADQIAVTSGSLQREWVANGRRYFHYKTDSPITHHMAFASARYAVTHSEWNGIAISVYHDPGHAETVARMIDAARKALAYNSTNFGPYQHQHLRIVEFPRYVRDGTSFPGMITLSESMGFNARLGGTSTVDFPFYVTAHEVAHQWWGQQLVGANAQGTGTLHETLAQYSALMVAEQEFGRQQMPPILAYEQEWYLRGRANERGVERSLAYVDRQEYVYYHKGALAMYALRDAVGEAPLNRALSAYLSRVAFKGPPYTTATELVSAIRAGVPNDAQPLVTDLFERNVRFNNTLVAAHAKERADGTYLVRLEWRAKKLQSDSAGTELELPIDDWMDIAILNDEAHEPVVLREVRQRVRSATSILEIVVSTRPTRVTIDPYHKLLDRDSGDNARRVEFVNSRP